MLYWIRRDDCALAATPTKPPETAIGGTRTRVGTLGGCPMQLSVDRGGGASTR
jgi:hypothetical protein